MFRPAVSGFGDAGEGRSQTVTADKVGKLTFLYYYYCYYMTKYFLLTKPQLHLTGAAASKIFFLYSHDDF